MKTIFTDLIHIHRKDRIDILMEMFWNMQDMVESNNPLVIIILPSDCSIQTVESTVIPKDSLICLRMHTLPKMFGFTSFI